jgi:hypothetical protein
MRQTFFVPTATKKVCCIEKAPGAGLLTEGGGVIATMKRLFKTPGARLMLMFCWIIPFFVIAFVSYQLKGCFSSYLHFSVAIGVPLIVAAALNAVYAKYPFWKDMENWGRFSWLTGSYAVVILLLAIITVTLASYGLIGYFRGDAEGSFGMLYLPSLEQYRPS